MNDQENKTDEIVIPDLPEVKTTQSEEVKVPQQAKPKTNFKLKFYCNGCSGRAFLSEEKEEFDVRTCQTCGVAVHYNPENYLPLSETEMHTLNG